MTTISADTIAWGNAQSQRLRDLLHAPEILVMPGAFNVLSALLFQHLGFKAIQGSSAGFANALGYADLGIPRETTVEVTRLVAGAVTVPVNADGEDGYGGPDEVRKTVRAMIGAGAAGMNMEDSDRNTPGTLLPLEFQIEKIAAFVDERKALGSEFVLNARVDAFIAAKGESSALPEAVRRGQAYAEAGGDSIFFFGVSKPEDIRVLAKEVPAPISVLAGPGTPGPREMQELGVARVSYGSQFLRMAVGAVKRFSEELLEKGTHESLAEAIGGGEMKAILGGRREA